MALALPRPRPILFSQGEGQGLRCQGQYQGQDLVIQGQGQGPDLHEVSSRILEAKARPLGQQDWLLANVHSLLCHRPYVVCLSVTFVRPTQANEAIEIIENVSTPFGTSISAMELGRLGAMSRMEVFLYQRIAYQLASCLIDAKPLSGTPLCRRRQLLDWLHQSRQLDGSGLHKLRRNR